VYFGFCIRWTAICHYRTTAPYICPTVDSTSTVRLVYCSFPWYLAEHFLAPLPEQVWENLDELMYNLPPRTLGLPTNITGAGYFEYFLPLMSILGDIIEVHHLQNHPRLGKIDYGEAVETIARMIDDCEASLEYLAQELDSHAATADASAVLGDDRASRSSHGHDMGQRGADSAPYRFARDTTHFRLVIAYSTHILHVLRVLLHGKWDAISMMDNEDDWITTPRFVKCASHAIAASEAVSEILTLDPELTFMPYLFGIYLLHGSFILLLFADRMPQVGQNRSVEQACETIVRAHEVCVVTLSTEFQVSVI
jgi:xylanolytic transcriptional activator XlnR